MHLLGALCCLFVFVSKPRISGRGSWEQCPLEWQAECTLDFLICKMGMIIALSIPEDYSGAKIRWCKEKTLWRPNHLVITFSERCASPGGRLWTWCQESVSFLILLGAQTSSSSRAPSPHGPAGHPSFPAPSCSSLAVSCVWQAQPGLGNRDVGSRKRRRDNFCLWRLRSPIHHGCQLFS